MLSMECMRRGTARSGRCVPLASVVQARWVDRIDHSLPDEINYCEIGHIDQMGRVSPVRVTRDVELVDNPEADKQLARLRKKAYGGKSGRVDGWAVLGPKTRTYQRKYGIVTGMEDSLYTTDLMVLTPGCVVMEACSRRAELACSLLWLMFKSGPLGDAFDALSRWGKEYPTINLNDLANARIAKSALAPWTSVGTVEMARVVSRAVIAGVRCQRRIRGVLQDPIGAATRGEDVPMAAEGGWRDK